MYSNPSIHNIYFTKRTMVSPQSMPHMQIWVNQLYLLNVSLTCSLHIGTEKYNIMLCHINNNLEIFSQVLEYYFHYHLYFNLWPLLLATAKTFFILTTVFKASLNYIELASKNCSIIAVLLNVLYCSICNFQCKSITDLISIFQENRFSLKLWACRLISSQIIS